MEYLLLGVFAFLRPVLFVDLGLQVGGLNLFELSAIALSAVLFGGLLIHAALTRSIRLSVIDLLIAGFVLWCITIFLAYVERADVRELAKFVLPFLTYIVVKSVAQDRDRHRKLMWVMILGFSIPVLASAGLIAVGLGVDRINYWTGEIRYLGVYTGPHNMAHNMTFLLMLMGVYFLVDKAGTYKAWSAMSRPRKVLIVALAGAALYCLFFSAVRTALIGLLVFWFVVLWFHNRRLLLIGAALVSVTVLVFSGELKNRLFYEAVMSERTGAGVKELASGRPRIWQDNLSEFVTLPLDRQLAGVGIGNDASKPGSDLSQIIESHNDFLQVLMQTGIVGFVLFIGLQFAVLRAILRLEGYERSAFLAVFIAVTVMNFSSNSYVARFGLAQMLYVLLAYVEIPRSAARGEGVPSKAIGSKAAR